MLGSMLRLFCAALACAFGFVGCAMILIGGPSAALLSVGEKCAERVDRAVGQRFSREVTAD
jgi:hypothetical protein